MAAPGFSLPVSGRAGRAPPAPGGLLIRWFAAVLSLVACLLMAARFGDRVIDLLVANRRGPELDRALDAYLAASQRCRRAAAPGP